MFRCFRSCISSLTVSLICVISKSEAHSIVQLTSALSMAVVLIFDWSTSMLATEESSSESGAVGTGRLTIEQPLTKVIIIQLNSLLETVLVNNTLQLTTKHSINAIIIIQDAYWMVCSPWRLSCSVTHPLTTERVEGGVTAQSREIYLSTIDAHNLARAVENHDSFNFYYTTLHHPSCLRRMLLCEWQRNGFSDRLLKLTIRAAVLRNPLSLSSVWAINCTIVPLSCESW